MPGTHDAGAWQPTIAQRRCVALVAQRFGYKAEDLLGRGRQRPMVHARFAAVWVLSVAWPRLSSLQLGRVMGSRDHSTILYALKQARRLRAADRRYHRATQRLAARCAMAAREARVVPLRVRAAIEGEELQKFVTMCQIEEDGAEDFALPAINPGSIIAEGERQRLPVEEILQRRAAREDEVRERQLAQLEAERQRYNLPRRGRALFEMPV